MNIEWTQVLIAFFLGVILAAFVRNTFSSLRSRVGA